MTTSWQLSREADVERQVHRVEQLYHNFCQKAKRTRLILEYFEDGVKDSALELKYASEAQFRINAPKVEGKLLEAIKFEKQIQHLFEQNMALHTTEFRCPADANVPSHKPSYTMTPVGVYTPDHTPCTGISSYPADSTFRVFGQSPEGMETFPQNISNIMTPAFNLQTVLSKGHNGEDTEAQNVKNEESLSNKSIPKCNLSFSEDDGSLYSTEKYVHKLGLDGGTSLYRSQEYATQKLCHSGNIDLPSSGIENSGNMNKNNPNDACIEIPEDIFIPANNTVISEPDEVFVSANNTVNSDGFLTPKTNNEIVIDIDTNVFHNNDQLESSNEGEFTIMNPADHTGSAKRKRDSTFTSPIKINESNAHLNESENVNAANATQVNAACNVHLNASEMLSAENPTHVDAACNDYLNASESSNAANTTHVNAACNDYLNVSENVNLTNAARVNSACNDYLNASENVYAANATHFNVVRDPLCNSSLDDGLSSFHVEIESVNQKITQNDDILTNAIDQNMTQMNDTLNNTLNNLQAVMNSTKNYVDQKMTQENILKSTVEQKLTKKAVIDNTESFKHKENMDCLTADTEIKTEITTLNEETVINFGHVMYDITLLLWSVPPLEQNTSVYATHFEAPNQVWIQLEDCGIENFQYELNVIVRKQSVPVPEEFITLNSVVVAPYDTSNEFYRAQICSIIKGNEETYVQVTYLDYGNSETVKMSSLVMMPESLLNVPCKAIACVLEKVNGADVSSWSEQFDLLFTQLVNNTPLYAYIKQSEAEHVKGAREYSENGVSGLKPRYVITLSEDFVNETVKSHMESSIADSVELDNIRNGSSCSSGSTSYLSYRGVENELCQTEENIKQAKIVNTSEDAEISQQKHDPTFKKDDVECSQKLDVDISKVVNCLQKMVPDELSKNYELKTDCKTSEIYICPQKISPDDLSTIKDLENDSKTSVKETKVQAKDLPTDDEKAYTALQGLCTTERTVDKKVKKSLQRKSANTDNVNLVNKSEHKKDLENKTVSEILVEPESNDNGYSGKWSCLVTDATEYTLNAAGKVVNFNSNESCKVKPGNSKTHIKSHFDNSSMQKSCRKRQMSGNASVSQNTLGTIAAKQIFNHIHPVNSMSEYCSLLKNQTSERQQQQDGIKKNENKSTHLILQSSNGKQSPISDDGNALEYVSNVLAGSVKAASDSGSDIFLPVEVLPDVKLHKQTVSLGAEEQIQVMVSHVDSPNSFFLHLINSETACIERYTENMTEHYKNDSDDLKVDRLPIGSFWAVRFKEKNTKGNCWYRAQVLASQPRKANEDLHVKVRFVDYGDSGIISIKDVRVLAETFTFMPMLALPCSLAKVSPLNEWEENPWTQQNIGGFIHLIGNFTSVLQANFISYSLNAHYDVVLENEFGVINEMMVKKGFAKSLQLQSIGKDLFPGYINADDDSMINNASDSPILDDLSILSCVKQTFKFTSVSASTPLQPSKWANNKGPVSVKLLKNSNQNIPILPLNIKSDVGKNIMTPNNINDDKCERGFIRKLCESYGFIEHFGYQSSLFFHYSEFYGDIDFLDIGDLVEFEICFDEFRLKPMAIEVVQTMSHQERLVGFVNEEILKSCDRKQCITYMDGERFLYILFDKDDVEGYVDLKPLDKVSFSINLDKNRGALTATCISLESMAQPCETDADISGSLMDCQPQDTRWDPMAESYSKGYNYHNDECAETLISGMKNEDLTRLCKFYRVNGECPRGDTCRFEHTLINKAHTVEKEEVFMDLLGDPNLPKEESVVAMVVTYVESPGMFYCYLPYGAADLRPGCAKDSGIGLTNNGEGLGGLLQSMSDHYRHSLPTPNRALPAAGELKAAPLPSEDGEHEWWRVRVLEITGNELDNVQVKVHFLDYGEVKWIEETKLRPLDVQFLHLPAQALECWLYDVPIPQTGWTSAAKEHFTDLTKERMLVGQILHSDERIQRLGVKLYDTSGVSEININDVMINY